MNPSLFTRYYIKHHKTTQLTTGNIIKQKPTSAWRVVSVKNNGDRGLSEYKIMSFSRWFWML
jgi:hypothetical protein